MQRLHILGESDEHQTSSVIAAPVAAAPTAVIYRSCNRTMKNGVAAGSRPNANISSTHTKNTSTVTRSYNRRSTAF